MLGDWKSASLYPPDRLIVQLTNICNANCTFCAYQYLKDPKSFMNDNVFNQSIDQYHELGGEFVDLTPLVGDLLIDPKVFDRIKYVTSKKFKKVRFFTNGILLSRKNYPEKLVEAKPTHVTFSVPGFDKEMYERVYRSKSYNAMLKGISRFLEINNNLEEKIHVSFALKPDVPDEIGVYTEDYKRWIEPYIDRSQLHFVRDLDNWGGSIKQKDLTGNMRLVEPIPIEKKKFPCYFTFFLAIMVDGSIRLCGCRFNNGTEYDGLVVGHIEKESLLEVWQSKKVETIRNNFLKGDLISVCQTCTHYGPYSGKERSINKIKDNL